MIKLGISGISGRVGSQIIENYDKDEFIISSGLSRSQVKIDGVNSTSNYDDFLKNCEVVIDFSSPNALLEICETNMKYNRTVISGTTGLTEMDLQKLIDYSKKMKIFHSGNMSYGIILMKQIVQQLSNKLPNSEIEISEAHHRNKKDSPSGTSLLLANAVAKERNLDQSSYKLDRNGVRSPNDIGFSVKRAGEIVGEHSVEFYFDNQVIKVEHRAFDRKIFALGALKIAKIVHTMEHKCGLFGIDDIV